MNMTLMIVKLSTSETLLTDLGVDEEHKIYILLNPILLNSAQTPKGEVTIASQYMPGLFDDVIFVRFDSVITLCEASPFYRKLYGTALLRAYIQHESQQLAADGNEDEENLLSVRVKLKKVELMAHYGIIDEEKDSTITSVSLH